MNALRLLSLEMAAAIPGSNSSFPSEPRLHASLPPDPTSAGEGPSNRVSLSPIKTSAAPCRTASIGHTDVGTSGSVSLQSRSSRKAKTTQKLESCRWGCPETGLSLLLRGLKLGLLQRSLVKRRHLLRHMKRLLRSLRAVHTWHKTAQPQLRAAYSRLRSEDRSAIW
jgi:hypothetical protein